MSLLSIEEPFHTILKKERASRGWSQEDLAQKLGCDLKTIGRWENGKALPQALHRQALSQLLKKDLLELGPVSDAGTIASGK